MDRDQLSQIVCDVVAAQAALVGGQIGLDTPLGGGGLGIDSIGCLEIVLELERRTGIPLRDEHLTAESLATSGSLIQLLEQAQRR
jgi:acyl carrier protein